MGIATERTVTAQHGGCFIGWFLLFPGARIRLVLRRSKAGRQQSQEEDSESQPACSLMQTSSLTWPLRGVKRALRLAIIGVCDSTPNI